MYGFNPWNFCPSDHMIPLHFLSCNYVTLDLFISDRSGFWTQNPLANLNMWSKIGIELADYWSQKFTFVQTPFVFVLILPIFKMWSKKNHFFLVRKVRVTDWVTQFCQPIFINSKPDQKPERSEMNRPIIPNPLSFGHFSHLILIGRYVSCDCNWKIKKNKEM